MPLAHSFPQIFCLCPFCLGPLAFRTRIATLESTCSMLFPFERARATSCLQACVRARDDIARHQRHPLWRELHTGARSLRRRVPVLRRDRPLAAAYLPAQLHRRGRRGPVADGPLARRADGGCAQGRRAGGVWGRQHAPGAHPPAVRLHVRARRPERCMPEGLGRLRVRARRPERCMPEGLGRLRVRARCPET
eukprot:363545-Chlamydomonas_euryale.AAC.2